MAVGNLPKNLATGIYFGFARISDGPIYQSVVSVGMNPFYKNERKSVEAHLLHSFSHDFYGESLSLLLLGYIRHEHDYPSVQALIDDIYEDISYAKERLRQTEFLLYGELSSFASFF